MKKVTIHTLRDFVYSEFDRAGCHYVHNESDAACIREYTCTIDQLKKVYDSVKKNADKYLKENLRDLTLGSAKWTDKYLSQIGTYRYGSGYIFVIKDEKETKSMKKNYQDQLIVEEAK
jgi:phage terminase large subunit